MAKVGSTAITKAQLQAAMTLERAQYRKERLPFPRAGTAEYLLLRQQALDFLVEQARAHQIDAKLGIKPEDRVLTNASFVKITTSVRVTDAEVDAYFREHRKQYRHASRPIDRGTAFVIRSELLRKQRGVVVRRFVADTKRRYPVTYMSGYEPVSTAVLARRIWGVAAHKTCDLPPGSYPYAKARDHGCLTEGTPIPGIGAKPCTLVEFPGAINGFTGAEEDDGFAEFITGNAGTCTGDPRLQSYEVAPKPNTTPAIVSYLPGRGTATFRDKRFGWTLRYPRRLHALRINQVGFDFGREGIEIANFNPSATDSERPFAPGAIEFSLTQFQGGPFVGASLHDTRFPLTPADFKGVTDLRIQAAGASFVATIRQGSAPSRQDLAALRKIIESIRFPPLRVGSFAPSGYYVLGRASSYPVGSVTQIDAGIPLPYSRPGSVHRSGRFYLERAADGFWTITWPDNLLHGYKACGPHFDAKRRRFTCPSGAVWDVKGKVVRNPDPAQDQDDPLDRAPATISYDGYVLVALPPPP